MELIADKQFPANYSDNVLNVLKAMSMTNLKSLKVFGSSNIRSQLYAGDYDALEKVQATSIQEIANNLQSIMKQLRSMNVVVSEVKCGEIPEWDVFAPNAKIDRDGKVVNFNIKQSQSIVDRLRTQNIISPKDAKEANELLEQANSSLGFLIAKKSIRHHILRWTPREILEGVKILKGDQTITLENAIETKGMIKVDAIADINNRFTEFSVIYDVYMNKQHITKELPPLVEGLIEDMMYYEKTNPFKALKRLFSLAKHFKEYTLLEKIVPILNGDLGRLYQIIGDLKTLHNLLGTKTRPTKQIQIIRSQIDDMRERMGNIYELKDFLNAEHSIIGSIFSILKTPIPKLAPKLEKLIEELQTILDSNTLKQVGSLKKKKLKGKGKEEDIQSFLNSFKQESLPTNYTGNHIVRTAIMYYLIQKYDKSKNISTYRYDKDEARYKDGIETDEEGHLTKESVNVRELKQQIKTFVDKGFEIIFIPLSINFNDKGHSNMLVYRVKEKILERFEPHGAITDLDEPDFNSDILDKEIKKLFSFLKAKYISPKDFMTEDGFQNLEEEDEINEGFCIIWCMFYCEMVCKFPSLSAKEIFTICSNYFKTDNQATKFIKSFIKYWYDIVNKDYNGIFKINISEESTYNEKFNMSVVSSSLQKKILEHLKQYIKVKKVK